MFSVFNNKVLPSVLALLTTDALASYCPSTNPITVGNYNSGANFVVGTGGLTKNGAHSKMGVESLKVCT